MQFIAEVQPSTLNCTHGGSHEFIYEKEVGVFGEIRIMKMKDNTECRNTACRDYKPTLLKNKNV